MPTSTAWSRRSKASSILADEWPTADVTEAMPTAVFRADASPALGGGHVSRCLTLAHTLTARGWHCGFACSRETHSSVQKLKQGEVVCLTLEGSVSEEIPAMRSTWPRGCDWLIVDHYARDGVYEKKAKPWARRILSIDDVPNRRHDCDVLLDQTLGRDPAAYRNLVPERCDLRLGPVYAMIDPDFARFRSSALSARDRPARRLLVTAGLGNPAGILTTFLRGVQRANLGLHVDIAVGHTADDIDEVVEIAGQLSPPAAVYLDARNMVELMSCADVALGAGGTTSWERCCLGLTAIIVVTADNQRGNAEALASAGAAELLGDANTVTADDIAAALTSLIRDDARRVRMSERARSICDGQGAARVADLMVARMSEHVATR